MLDHTDSMFPNDKDLNAFRSEYGSNSILQRLPIPGQASCGTRAAMTIAPEHSKEATLEKAWVLVRSISRWILLRTSELPASESYEVIIGWDQSVRDMQGQIFKIGGDKLAIQAIADSAEWSICGHAPLLGWEKDVFNAREG